MITLPRWLQTSLAAACAAATSVVLDASQPRPGHSAEAIDTFALLPEFPLTCEFYGLALPNNDPDWQTTVNQFLVSDGENAVAADWLTDLYPATLDQTEFCLNR